MAIKKKMLQAAAGNAGGGGAAGPDVEDVFSTYLYEGNDTGQTITNGIDLAGEGGLVWYKARTDTAYGGHLLVDTERGVRETLYSAQTNTQLNRASVTAFNSNGYTIGDYLVGNVSGADYVSWTFRKAPKFFDVVTYTGTGTAQAISHDLNAEVGCIMVKNLDSAENWRVYHRKTDATAPEDYALGLNTTDARIDSTNRWNDTAPTTTQFTVGTDNAVNKSGDSFVAYLFAHNDGDGDFGPDGDADIIKCGSYTGNFSSDGPEIDLGFEPQWVLIKAASNAGDWYVLDNMRGISTGSNDVVVEPNNSDAEYNTSDVMRLTPTGFKIDFSGYNFNGNGYNFIYIAIRRGTKAPESGTDVFAMGQKTTNFDGDYDIPVTLGKPIDLAFIRATSGSWRGINRVTGYKGLYFNTTDAEHTLTEGDDESYFDSNTTAAVQATSATGVHYSFGLRRAPKFFDVVAYTGDTVAGRTVKHSLGVAPEMMWVKNREDGTKAWRVYHSSQGATKYATLNTDGDFGTATSLWNDTEPTESVFSVGSNTTTNSNNEGMIAYLFASLDGVSKVGSYTGNGTSQTIDCGFDSGARFIMVKRADSTGDWYVWDTQRGIVAGNDPYLKLNTTNSEVTSTDWIDPENTGFIVNGTTINASSATYIFYAIA